MTRSFIAAIVSLTLSASDQTQSRFASGTSVVRLDVSVTAGSQPVRGLTASDFIVRDNHVQQRVRVTPISDEPLDVSVLVDQSGSMRSAAARVRSEERAIRSALSDADQLTLYGFGTTVRVLAAPDEMLERPAGFTALYDALAAVLMKQGPLPRRRLLFVVSDGLDNRSVLSSPEVRDLCERGDTVLYALITAAPADRRALRGEDIKKANMAVSSLRAMADVTGGGSIPRADEQTLSQTVARMIREFRTGYLVSYETEGPPPSGWHQVETSIARQDAKYTVKTRTRYFVR